jgi:hypothetical protein
MPSLDAKRRKPKRRLFGLEKSARMGLEGHHPMRAARGPGQRARRADYCTVAAMDAVEIADGQRGTAPTTRQFVGVTNYAQLN